jgi:hypothetical protein
MWSDDGVLPDLRIKKVIMEYKPLIPELSIDENDINIINTKLFNSFNEQLFAENKEMVASIEHFRKQSAIINKSYTDILAETNKLLQSMIELISLTKEKR